MTRSTVNTSDVKRDDTKRAEIQQTPGQPANAGLAWPDPQFDPPQEERQAVIRLLANSKIAAATTAMEDLGDCYPRSHLLALTLAFAYKLQNEDDKAIASFQRAIALAPGDTLAYRHLGELLLNLERFTDAQAVFESGAKVDPADALIQRGLMIARVDLTNFDQSVDDLEQQLKDNPGDINLLMVLGQCYLHQEQFKKAVYYLEKGLELHPGEVDIMLLLGEAYEGFKKHREALEWFEKVRANSQPSVRLLLAMAESHKGLNQIDAAIACVEEAAAINAEAISPKNALAHIHATLGDKATSIALFEEALAQQPGHIPSIIGICNMTRVEKGSTYAKHLKNALIDEPKNIIDEKQNVTIAYTLGKIHSDIGQYKKALEYIHEGSALRRQQLHYDIGKDLEKFDDIQRIFDHITPDDAARNIGKDDRQMIFVLGMPRSGTTLTEQIISSHSRVYGAGELNFMNEETAELMLYLKDQPEVKLETIAFESIRKAYLGHIDSLGISERVVTDKMPHNFLRLGYILSCFPEATVIHLNRDPVAVCLSCYQRFFPAKGMGFTYRLRDLGHYYGKYLELMEYWRQKFPGRIIDLDYQQLTENQEPLSRQLLEQCGISWEDQCLEFHETKRGVLTASQLQVREKMYTGSSEAWKKYRRYLGELFKALDEAGVPHHG